MGLPEEVIEVVLLSQPVVVPKRKEKKIVNELNKENSEKDLGDIYLPSLLSVLQRMRRGLRFVVLTSGVLVEVC